MPASDCFHCGQPVPDSGPKHQIVIHGKVQPVCCVGCEMAAQWIDSAGLGAYYRWRTTPAVAPVEPPEQARFIAYDRPQAQRSFVVTRPDGSLEAELLVENLNCAACAWLIETVLGGTPGVHSAVCGFATDRLHLRYDPVRTDPARLAELIKAGPGWESRVARRLLQERASEGKDVSAAVGPLRAVVEVAATRTGRLEALWALHAMGKLAKVEV